ncbi:MAG: T9SS type A sorting domain-containing protein [Flavobacteriales bacterium]|nr:T9SS type A sorting domain-containing protein [Flavobacteriales bacterium]
MKTLRYALPLLLLWTSAHAQQAIVITRTDMPNINDTLRFSVADNLLGIIDLNDTGADHVWNYVTLPAYSQRVEEFVDPVFGTPLVYNITFSNFFDMDHFSTIAAANMFGPQFGFGPVQLEEVYDFYRETNDFFANVGMGATVNSVPLTSRMVPRDFIYRFPMEYGDADQSFSQFGFDVPDFGHYGQKLLRTNTVDGWGKLTTRYGTFDVLRVYTELERTDTVSLQGFGFEQERPKEFEYKWMAKSKGLPLLKVSGQFLFGQKVVNEVVYRDSVRGFTQAGPFIDPEDTITIDTLSVLDIQGLEQLMAFPNPVTSQLRLTFHLSTPMVISLQIMDISGRNVAPARSKSLASGLNSWPVDFSAIAPGMYLVSLTAADGSRSVMRIMCSAP